MSGPGERVSLHSTRTRAPRPGTACLAAPEAASGDGRATEQRGGLERPEGARGEEHVEGDASSLPIGWAAWLGGMPSAPASPRDGRCPSSPRSPRPSRPADDRAPRPRRGRMPPAKMEEM